MSHSDNSDCSISGGYEANFNPPLDDRYKCPICLAALKDPVQTRCGHRMCSTCFKSIRGGAWYFRCPVDNTWSNHVFDDNAAKREVLSLKVDCINKDTCKWTGELRELEKHVKDCDYQHIECPEGCNTPNIMRVDLDKHLLECPMRLEKCTHCSADVLSSKLVHHHLLDCPKFPVNCPNCGESRMTREKMHAHLNIITGDCPMVIVPCSFRYIGCMHQDHRTKMTRHYQEASTNHLMLLSTRIIDLETKNRIDLEMNSEKQEKHIAELRERLEINERRNCELNSVVDDLKKKLELLQKQD